MNADGSAIRRLCFDQDHNFYPTVMADGRVLYTRWEYTDIAHAFTGRLMTMNPDGTGQRAHYASGSFWPNRIFYARPIPDHPTKFVAIVTGHHGTARAGELVVFDVAKGRRQAEGVVQRIPGWGKTVEAKMVDNLVDASWPKFLHPYPLSDKYFLVSCQPTSQSRWGIYLVDVFDNMLLLCEEDGCVLFEPVPVRKTPRPPGDPRPRQPRQPGGDRLLERHLRRRAGCEASRAARSRSSGSSPTTSTTTARRASRTTWAWTGRGTCGACWAPCPWPPTARPTSPCRPTRRSPCSRWTPRARPCS